MNERKSAHHNQKHNDEMTEFEIRLSDRIHNSVIDLPPAKGPDAAVDRAHSRTRHRRGVLAGAAALALVAGVVGQTVADDSDAGLDTAGTMNVDNDGVKLDWQVTDDGLGSINSYSGTDAGLYALSTAPGASSKDFPDGNVPRAMYRLAEDGTWTPIELGDDDPAVGRISERGGALYALSTAADTGQPVGSISTDGGENWADVPLKAIEPPSDTVSWGLYYSLELASTDDVTFGLVTAQFYFPAEKVFPEMAAPYDSSDESKEYYWDYTDEGVRLILAATSEEVADVEAQESAASDETGVRADPESASTTQVGAAGGIAAADDGDDDQLLSAADEVVRTVPWSDLGLTSAADLAPRTTAYLVDGETWTEVAPPMEPSVNGWTTVVSTGDNLVAARIDFDENGSGSTTVSRSTNGITWSGVTAPGPGTTVATPAGLLHSSDGPEDHNSINASTDNGASWYELDLATIDPRIEELGVSYHQMYGGPLGAAIVITEDSDDGAGASYLAFSNDLTSWTVTDLRELSPDSNWFGQVLVGTDRLVVHGVGDANGEDEPQDTQTLIAVPTR